MSRRDDSTRLEPQRDQLRNLARVHCPDVVGLLERESLRQISPRVVDRQGQTLTPSGTSPQEGLERGVVARSGDEGVGRLIRPGPLDRFGMRSVGELARFDAATAEDWRRVRK